MTRQRGRLQRGRAHEKSETAYEQPGKSHRAGRCPEWRRLWRCRAPESLEAYPQPGALHRYGLSPASTRGERAG